jgi:hypothetical protein
MRKTWLVGALAAAAAACDGDGGAAAVEPDPRSPDAGVAPDAFEQGAAVPDAMSQPAVDGAPLPSPDAAPPVDAEPPVDAAPAPDASTSGCAPITGLVETPQPASWLADVWAGPTTVWAVGGDGVVARRDSAGWCWYRLESPVLFGRVLGFADDDVWISGAAGTLVHIDGTGATRVDTGTTVDLFALWGTSSTSLWIGGRDGTVAYFDGATWHSRPLPPDHEVSAIGGASADAVLVAASYASQTIPDSTLTGQTATIYRWNDVSGWRAEARSVQDYGASDFRRIDGSSATDLWAVGNKQPPGSMCGGHQAWHYDGTAWSHVPAYTGDGCGTYSDVLVDGAQVWFTVWTGGIARYSDGAWTEGDPDLTGDLSAIARGPDALWAVGGHWDPETYVISPRILRYRDGAWRSDL